MRLFWIILLSAWFISLLTSCGHKQWSQKGLKKGWVKENITKDTIISRSFSHDTIVHVYKDTIIIHQGKLTEKVYYHDSTIYLKNIIAPDTVIVTKSETNINTTNKSKLDEIEERGFKWLLVIIGAFIALQFLGSGIKILESRFIK